MKKLIFSIMLITAMLGKPFYCTAQADGAMITSFLAPYMAALQGLSKATGMSIDEIKEAAQKTIKITNDIIKTYYTSADMVELGSTVQDIYVSYLDGIKYLYENNLYFTEQQSKDMIHMLDYTSFGYIATDRARPKGINNVAGGALSSLPQIFKAQGESGNTSIKDVNDLMLDTKKRVRKSLSDTRAVNRYMQGIVRKKEYELGMRDISIHKRKVANKFGL